MPFPVQLTAHAVGDLEDILAYIDRRDGPNRVEQVLDQIEQTLQGLSHHPHRGSYPDEFLDMGIREYRQVLSRPYRIIYRVIGESVYVFLIADGRRNIRTLLQRRLLR